LKKNNALVTGNNACFSGSGGVQWCTSEYLRTLGEVFEVSIVGYDSPRGLMDRISRKLARRPFSLGMPKNAMEKIMSWAGGEDHNWVFLNNTCALEFVRVVPREKRTNIKTIFLSHGAQITDEVNERVISDHAISAAKLKRTLVAEITLRRALDGVICISEEDAIFERWLGSTNVCFIPRMIARAPLPLQPRRGLIGTVSTLSHGPNVQGIRFLAEALDRAGSDVRLRLVGGPDAAGENLAREYASVDYCGRLNDAELEREAATWCAFANPIFCQARGASTKIATALGWGLPVLTTRQGVRGYRWDVDALPLASSATELAAVCRQVALSGDRGDWRKRAETIIDLAPSLAQTAKQLADFLKQI